MDRTLLSKSRQACDDQYRYQRAVDLLKKGYQPAEIKEVFRRADLWVLENVELNAGNGQSEPMRRDFSAAIAEVLQDSADIATGAFLSLSAQDEQN